MILALGAAARFILIGDSSFWYDEVVAIRLARAPTVAAMLQGLRETDATRAPLHPLLLWGWVRAFGPSEASARSLSATCGVLTVLVVFAIGRRLGGWGAGLWSALAAASSPLLIVYSREARMYALLTLLTTLAWWNLLAMGRPPSRPRLVLHALLLAAMIYAHPLGVLMAGTLAVASIFSGFGRLPWMVAHLGAAALVLPWLPNYFDHPPEFLTPQSVRLLLGMPIGFVGGDSRSMVVLIGLIAIGLWPRPIPGLSRGDATRGAWAVVLWLVVPALIFFTSSQISWPVFGPARYNVYSAPAFGLLIGIGAARLRPLATVAVLMYLPSFLVGAGLFAAMQAPQKADWRRAAEDLDRDYPGVPVVVIAPTPGRNFEVEVARYYLGDDRFILPMPGTEAELLDMFGDDPGEIIVSASTTNATPRGDVPEAFTFDGPKVWHWDEAGLRLFIVRDLRGTLGRRFPVRIN